MPRAYRMQRRAERQEETRRRIAAAAAELHATVGPARTTVSAVAERAGVERLTVYRHFPDERALLRACSAHFMAAHPPPDPAEWQGIADPGERLRSALSRLYGYYRETEGMTANLLRDAPQVPALAEQLAPMAQFFASVREGLVEGWPGDEATAAATRALIGHALEFTTWRSLAVGQGLRDEAAAELMARVVGCAAGEAGVI